MVTSFPSQQQQQRQFAASSSSTSRRVMRIIPHQSTTSTTIMLPQVNISPPTSACSPSPVQSPDSSPKRHRQVFSSYTPTSFSTSLRRPFLKRLSLSSFSRPTSWACIPVSPLFYITVACLALLLLLNTAHDLPRLVTSSEVFHSRTSSPIVLDSKSIHSSLIYQHLSHMSFHKGHVKDALLSLICEHQSLTPATCPVVVVGVSHGAEVLSFARNGHRVFAVEAMEEPAKKVDRLAKSSKPPLDVHMFRAAATDKKGEHYVDIIYNKKLEKAPAKRVDDLIPNQVSPGVISIDIQGFELDAVKGMPRLTSQAGSIWVEMLGCNKKNKKLLNILSEHYYLYDMVPWGRSKNKQKEGDGLESFANTEGRPKELGEWDDWFCDMRTKKFKWLQTDIVGIEKSLIEGPTGNKLLKSLNRIWKRGCTEADSCALRNLKL